jgi:putative Mg2+ transporter-C (MgtC) family protein
MFDTLLDPALRLVAAMIAGMAIGLNRDLHGKPTGVRTLGLVGLGAALVTYGALHAVTAGGSIYENLDASSRAVQGLIQGLLTGIGFIGAGVILHDTSTLKVHGLTTAATVWVTAGIGLICGLGEWRVLAIAGCLVFALLIFGGPLERRFHHPTRDDHDRLP